MLGSGLESGLGLWLELGLGLGLGLGSGFRVRESASRQAEAKHARRQLQWSDAKRAEVMRGDAEGWAGKALASLSLDAGEQAAAAAARLRELDPDHPLLPVLEESLAAGGGR